MSELRFNQINGDWVIIAPERCQRPSDYILENEPQECPFCKGNEHLTTKEIFRINKEGDKDNWLVRVVPNKFPALRVEEQLTRRALGIFDIISGTGAHEVIIDTPLHDINFLDYNFDIMFNLYKTIRIRLEDLKNDERLRYFLPFKNSGSQAGATLKHPHSQIIALPELPEAIEKTISNAKVHFENKERCLFCDIVQQELSDKIRLIYENDSFVAFCPFASSMPFEVNIFPKSHFHNYIEINEKYLCDFSEISIKILKKLKKVKENLALNMFINTIPQNLKNNGKKYTDLNKYYHWHCVLLPRLMSLGGFELATKTTINTVSPEESAEFLRNVKVD